MLPGKQRGVVSLGEIEGLLGFLHPSRKEQPTSPLRQKMLRELELRLKLRFRSRWQGCDYQIQRVRESYADSEPSLLLDGQRFYEASNLDVLHENSRESARFVTTHVQRAGERA